MRLIRSTYTRLSLSRSTYHVRDRVATGAKTTAQTSRSRPHPSFYTPFGRQRLQVPWAGEKRARRPRDQGHAAAPRWRHITGGSPRAGWGRPHCSQLADQLAFSRAEGPVIDECLCGMLLGLPGGALRSCLRRCSRQCPRTRDQLRVRWHRRLLWAGRQQGTAATVKRSSTRPIYRRSLTDSPVWFSKLLGVAQLLSLSWLPHGRSPSLPRRAPPQETR
jgi:hypothetical protein